MRIVGIDFGERRMGVAVVDDRVRVAIPVGTVDVSADPVEDIVRLAQEQRAEELVVGLPLSLTGAEGPQAQRVRELIEALTSRLSIPIHAWDERLTTAEARRRAPPGGRRGREDALAAAIMLQSYMDHLRPYG